MLNALFLGTLLSLPLLAANVPAHPAFEPAPLPVVPDVTADSIGWGSIYTRYTPETVVTSPVSKALVVKGQPGEYVNAQFVFISPKNLNPLVYSISSENGAKANLFTVRNVLANGKLVPDILEPASTEIEYKANTIRTVWIQFEPVKKPGVYTYTFTIAGQSYPITLEIAGPVLPPVKDRLIHVDLWQTPQALAVYHDVPLWSKEHFDLMRPHYKRLASIGQRAVTCEIIDHAWNDQSYAYLPSMVKWTRKKDGSWAFDYTDFDRWVEFMDECGINEYIHCYTMITWHNAFKYFDEASGQYKVLKAEPKDPAYDTHWGPFLKDFTAHLKAKGWLEKTRIGMDERHDHLMLPAIAVQKKYAPELKLVSAVNKATDKTMDIANLSPAIHQMDASKPTLEKRRAKGLISTFYVCCNPRRPNTFMFSTLPESAWLGHYAAANELDGFLRWAFDNFTADPMRLTDYVSWPTGDCFLVYPGNRSSIRFELMRDGFEDYEKIRAILPRGKTPVTDAQKALRTHLDETYNFKRVNNKAFDSKTFRDDVEKTAELIRAAQTK